LFAQEIVFIDSTMRQICEQMSVAMTFVMTVHVCVLVTVIISDWMQL